MTLNNAQIDQIAATTRSSYPNDMEPEPQSWPLHEILTVLFLCAILAGILTIFLTVNP